MLEPSIDAYGTRGRVSVLADFIEVMVLNGGRCPTVGSLADFIEDTYGGQGIRAAYFEPDVPIGKEESSLKGLSTAEKAKEVAGWVFSLFENRSNWLNSAYPFDVGSDGRISLRGDPRDCAHYLLLLGVLVFHAYGNSIHTGGPLRCDVQLVFERITKPVLTGFSPLSRAEILGTSSSNGGGFAAVLKSTVEGVGLRADLTKVEYAAGAKDNGVDVVVHLDFGDDRLGRWVLLGQATCAKTDDWEDKVAEPGLDWKTLLNMIVSPLVFLAVPHHVDDTFVHKVMRKSGHMLLDRIRLVCLGKNGESWMDDADCDVIVDSLLDIPVADYLFA